MTFTTDASILNILPEPHVLLSRELIVLAANPPFGELLGLSGDQLVGRNAALFWPAVGDVHWSFREFPAEFRSNSGDAVTVKVASYCGEALLIRVLASFSENEITRVFHAQRLETLGMLAGGVAHDFNNILTGVLGHVAYLRSILPGTGPHIESLESIEDGAVRASSMTQQIVNFSRLQPTESSVRVSVSEVISRVCALMRGALPLNIDLRWVSPAERVYLLATEAHLCQVLINLIVNARDALDGTGSIEVGLEPKCSEKDVQEIFGSEPPASAYGVLVVRDDGSGMSDDVKARLFEPYFTTKHQGGTGLGLATVNSIVRSLGGAIIVESELGKGTTFRIVLPVVVEARQLETDTPRSLNGDNSSTEEGPIRGNGERILVIDDEYAVRNVLGLSLTHLGYTLETAASGLEGLEKYSDAEGDFSLIILDLLMPGLSGEEVFARLQRLNPAVRVLLVSGFSSETVVRRLLDAGGAGFIQKPFSIEILAEKVHLCLGS
jgi:two-component system cell cycle sensor histidine kinase/response regulator CckA